MAGGAHSALLRAPQVKTHQQRHQKDAQQPHGLGSQESDGRVAADFAGPTGLVPNPAVKTHVTGTPPEYQNPCSLLLPCGWPRKHPQQEGNQPPKGTQCLIPFIRNVQNRQIQKDREWIWGCQEPGEGGITVTVGFLVR